MSLLIDDLGKLRHTTAHVLAQAVKRLFPLVKLAIGPAVGTGFYYDFDTDYRFSDDDLSIIEKEMKKIIKENLKLERSVISRDEAFKLFKDEPYKLELIEGIPEGEDISIYRQGDFVDLCAGPHVESTGKIKAFKLLNIAGAYWRGDEHNKMLQRIYGTAFETKEQLVEYVKFLEEAEKYDHRKIGKEMDLFSLHDEAPGMPFFHPNGMIVMNSLLEYWREVHRKYGYDEISTPAMMKRQLWETSGHWNHYAQGMYTLKVDDEDYAVKPMNCPGAIITYKRMTHTYREFPLKYAEIGQVHRNEKSGELHGLFRVREFTQDDAHIFMEPHQITEVIEETIKLIGEVYGTFGLPYEMELSTRPENSMGTDEQWEQAENGLRAALKDKPYKINEGDGAFYGPKIDFHVKDRLGRTWQCGTIQLDFQLPERFELTYMASDGQLRRPVMIHRVIFGSIGRYLGIMVENGRGWLNLGFLPEMGAIISVSDEYACDAEALAAKMRLAGLRVKADCRSETVGKRIRSAVSRRVPYIVVYGERERLSGELKVRVQGRTEEMIMTAEEMTAYMVKKVKSREIGY